MIQGFGSRLIWDYANCSMQNSQFILGQQWKWPMVRSEALVQIPAEAFNLQLGNEDVSEWLHSSTKGYVSHGKPSEA